MARKKVKLALIANDSARKATFNKRKKGLIKKVSELSVLCGVSACAVVYGPYEARPIVWPSAQDAQRVLARLKSLPEMEQNKKMMNQEAFLRQRVAKLREQVKRQERENREEELKELMRRCVDGEGWGALARAGVEEVTALACMLEVKAKAVQERMEALRRGADERFGKEEKVVLGEAEAAAAVVEDLSECQ
ncbi:Agamous-like MADS-box protein AGL80 [Acorus calamus]|uniref:Agamous-like MADS-box protein AGL80 n=1 Tax=Acorus calamus TaxID=4465 RepID=A0AAV9EFE1_ACOCL|nr:Agamous-like MADS-box protein AGL80 [Acorus calamus]